MTALHCVARDGEWLLTEGGWAELARSWTNLVEFPLRCAKLGYTGLTCCNLRLSSPICGVSRTV